MYFLKTIAVAMAVCLFVSFKPDDGPFYQLQGRLKVKDGAVSLIGSASSVSFYFHGEQCSVTLQSVDATEHQNYAAIVVDGVYVTRLKIDAGPAKAYAIPIKEIKRLHQVTILKATEAANGNVVISKVSVPTVRVIESAPLRKKIEFIGDSVTCGMGNDSAEIPCYTGDWFDQHNAYFSFASITARNLDAEFLLSAVSGIGMYRNWNDEHDKEPVMPEVYENLYLNKNDALPYDFSFQPDIVVICLGTNDLSDGDRKKPRAGFDAAKFVAAYEGFLTKVYRHYPDARLVLLNSPMISGDRNAILVNCLKRVKAASDKIPSRKPVSIFEFRPMVAKGCGGHPSIADDNVLADQLTPFLKGISDK